MRDDIESLAALRRLQIFILQLGISNMILEGDSLTIIKDIHSNVPNFSRQGSMIAEIQSLLGFEKHKVIRVGQQGNEAAHLLARHACFVEDTIQWWHQYPDFIQSQVLLDGSL